MSETNGGTQVATHRDFTHEAGDIVDAVLQHPNAHLAAPTDVTHLDAPEATAATTTQTPDTPVNTHRWWTLGVLALSVSLIVIDGTIVNVALPVIIAALSLSAAQAAWVTTIYALVFSALLIISGRLGDRYGRKTTLLVGIVIFVIASLMASASQGATSMLAARALQGIGGALVLPSTLSTVNATFFGRDRRIAFAAWGAVIAGMAAVGPLLGGWIITSFDWRWIFTINLPIGILLLAGTLAFVPQTKGHGAAGADIPGFLTSSLGLAALVFGLIQGRDYGWFVGKNDASGWVLSPAFLALVCGVGLLSLFIRIEHERTLTDKPVLFDLSLFHYRSFSWGNIAAMVVAMGEFGLLFVLPLHLQNVMGLSAMHTGWILGAMAAGAFISGGMAAPLAQKIGPSRVATLGLSLEALGLALTALLLAPDAAPWQIALLLVIYGLGLGLASAQLTSVILADVPLAQSGVASAAQSTVRQVGTAMGIALASTLFVATLDAGAQGSLRDIDALPHEAAVGIEQSIAPSLGHVLQGIEKPDAAGNSGTWSTAQETMNRMEEGTRQAIATQIRAVSTSAARQTIGVAAGIILIGVLATLRLPPQSGRH